MKKQGEKIRERIPYAVWSNSHLSIAKYSGGIIINGNLYELDYENCKTTAKFGEDIKYFPDLILKTP